MFMKALASELLNIAILIVSSSRGIRCQRITQNSYALEGLLVEET